MGNDMSIAVVAGRFNHFIVDELVSGARDALARQGIDESRQALVWVPGAFEIPLAADRLAASRKYDAVIALGAVIRGGTPHFEYVAAEMSKGIAKTSLETGVPVINGVITSDNLEQAIERAGSKMGNKGFAAALGGIEMANLLKNLA